MVDRIDDELDEALPPLAVLEAYTVPDLPMDFTDRVMASLHPTTARPTAPVRAPWIVAGVATACAIAATVMLVLVQMRGPVPTTVVASTPPVPAADPVPVAAPPLPTTGDLVIEATPHDAIVRIDGKPITDTTGGSPFVRTNLAVGSHLVEVERDGFLPWHRSIDVPPRALHLTIALRATATPPHVESFVPIEATPEPTKPRRPKRPDKPSRTTSADLKDPFSAPPDDDTAKPDMKDPFGGY